MTGWKRLSESLRCYFHWNGFHYYYSSSTIQDLLAHPFTNTYISVVSSFKIGTLSSDVRRILNWPTAYFGYTKIMYYSSLLRVWVEISEFSATQILREINFGLFEALQKSDTKFLKFPHCECPTQSILYGN